MDLILKNYFAVKTNFTMDILKTDYENYAAVVSCAPGPGGKTILVADILVRSKNVPQNLISEALAAVKAQNLNLTFNKDNCS